MRIRRTILGPAILTIGTVGALVAAPAIAIAAPVGTAIPSLMPHQATHASLPDLMPHQATHASLPDLMPFN